jgi:hypothetical protein
MIPVPAVERLLSTISIVKNTYAITVNKIAVDRYMDSDWLVTSFNL